MTDPWYGEGLKFTCTMCGNCCSGPPGYVWFTQEEGRKLAARLSLSEREFYQRYAVRHGLRWSLGEIERSDGKFDCVFLVDIGQGKRGCAVYEDRPSQCRTWPFWPENLKSRRAYERAARTCPGMTAGLSEPGSPGVGTHYTLHQIRVLRDAT